MTRWVSTKHAAGLSQRRNANTEIERTLRRQIWSAGLRYRLHPQLGERLTGDFLIVPSRICVFVDGCFWHQCPRHKPRPTAGPNVDLWREKFERTKARDIRAADLAERLGYLPMRIWECEIRDDCAKVIRTLKSAVRRRGSLR